MADTTKKYVDYASLAKYDELIKGKMQADIGTEAARAAGVEAGLQDAIDILNGDDTTAGSVAKAVKDLDDQLAAVAKSGEAADVSYDNTSSGLEADDVQEAIDALATASQGGVASKTIYVTDESSGQSDYAKVYKIYQGANSPDAQTDPAVLKGTINIPKDKVLKDSSIVNITFSEDKLWDDDVDVTELIVGTGTPTAADAGKYLKMEMQNVDDPLYVNLQTFVDVYTVASGATEVQLALNDHELSASIVSVDGAKVVYKTETSAGAGDGETVKQALTRLDGDDQTEGSVRKIAKDAAEGATDSAIADLDTEFDIPLATHDASTGAVTFAGSMAEADGIIEAGGADNVIFTPVTNAEIQALFPTISA